MTQEDRVALEQLLDTHGGDRTRWPAADRLRFASMIARDPGAKRLVAEAAVFDRLLDMAPGPVPAQERMVTERVAALAMAERRSASVPRATPSLARPARRETRWPAAALLAASLILGVVIGGMGALRAVVGPELASLGGDSEGETRQMVLDDVSGLLAEDELL